MSGRMLVLGVDPGTATMGYGIVAEDEERMFVLEFGTIDTSPRDETPRRLQHLYRELAVLIEKYNPSDVVVEELFFNKNVRTAIAVGQARGVALLVAANYNIPVSEYTPLEVKQAIVGYGRASKEQVQQMVQILLNMGQVPQPDDAADALAAAICHVQTAKMRAAISQSE